MAKATNVRSNRGEGMPRIRRKDASFDMIEFVRPGGYWPNPYSLEQAFGVLQQAVTRSHKVGEQGRWGFHGVGDMLYGCGTVNHDEVEVTSLDCLRKTFHRLVLARANAPIERWRRENGLDVSGTFSGAFPHYAPFNGTPLQGNPRACERDIRNAVTWLLEGSRGRVLAVSVNSCHLVARTVGDVAIQFTPRGFRFVLEVKYDAEPCSSHWYHELARSAEGEPFTGTLDRAVTYMKLLLGKVHRDPGKLCRALNDADAGSWTTWEKRHWVLGRRPVLQSKLGDAPLRHMATCAKIGYGSGGASIVHIPSGRVLHVDRGYDRDRLDALLALLLQRFPEGSEPPDAEEVERIRLAETAEGASRHFDDKGRYLLDRDGNRLTPEQLAAVRMPPSDDEIDAEGLFVPLHECQEFDRRRAERAAAGEAGTEAAAEAAAAAAGWMRGGDNGGFVFDGNRFGNWKEAVSAEDASTYETFQACCEAEGNPY